MKRILFSLILGPLFMRGFAQPTIISPSFPRLVGLFELFEVSIIINTIVMKRSLLSSALCIIAISMSYAQSSKEVISQPTYVVARRVDANGTITKE